MKKNNPSKYILTLLITVFLFSGAFYLSNYFNNKKTESIRSTEDQISIDILSSETQFDIFKQSSCNQVEGSSALAGDLDTLGSRLTSMESQIGTDNPDVIQLKKYYSILQIKDYLLMNIYNTNCHTKPVTILYFYSDNCPDCVKQNYVLSDLHDAYPEVRIYYFDYNLDLSALKTLISLNKIPSKQPSFMINDKIYTGYMDESTMYNILNKLLPAASKVTATSTKK